MTHVQRTAVVTLLAIVTLMLFPDAAYSAENNDYIKWDKHEAYITGYPDNTFRPYEYMTREESASMFYSLIKERKTQKKDVSFNDVGADRWSYEAIKALAGMGIISGDDKGNFRPTDSITRAEMAVLMSELTNLNYDDKTFSDIKGHWAESYIIKAASEGWISGYTDGTFKPDEYITRGEAVLFINNALGRTPHNADDLLKDMKCFKDNSDTTAWYYLAVQEASNSHEYALRKNGTETWTLVI